MHKGILPRGLLWPLIGLRLLSPVNSEAAAENTIVSRIGAVSWPDDDENSAGLMLRVARENARSFRQLSNAVTSSTSIRFRLRIARFLGRASSRPLACGRSAHGCS